MTIKQQGGIFGRNPTFNNVTADNVTVDSELGIGTNDPARTLHVNSGTVDISALFESTDDPVVVSFWNGTGGGNIKVAGSDFNFRTGGNSTGAGGTNRLTVASSGNVTVETGNLVIGTSGKGIDFSATSGTGTSELFDDYEEGSFTPVVSDAASAGNEGTASGAYGYYTKIGQQATLQITFLNINTSGMTGSNDLYITGLPFPAKALTGANYFTGNMSASLLANTIGIGSPEVLDNTSYIRIREWGNNTGTDFSLVSDLTSGSSDLNITLTYFAA
tara:strand:- start:206 stop:1030 length:825 start_codon:yes stop_codon:yes gene_type:complete